MSFCAMNVKGLVLVLYLLFAYSVNVVISIHVYGLTVKYMYCIVYHFSAYK